jgi:hypothetical protein
MGRYPFALSFRPGNLDRTRRVIWQERVGRYSPAKTRASGSYRLAPDCEPCVLYRLAYTPGFAIARRRISPYLA